ncbi:OTU domain-containing protein 5 isoform X1 [Stomoxys calcitrans]|uniref:OTU domain-containing protein 5 isoform X1 n=1 Tax=Stomoxys calcitrans TaxID=35570 RepID=UPI0027E37EAC|nr:OTU domain-containing protein 5 isoform X1 [Stomoxys calcitrans]XP_059216172.1 OTU domain-containing protein 5 isoform X1 [Stomoxys calcitrans]
MTIKPVVAAPQKRSGSSGTGDSDKKDTHTGSSVGDATSSSHQQTNRAANVHAHRNVVIDNHSQSPQRRGVDVYEELNRHRRSPHKTTRTKRRDHLNDHHHKRDRVSAHPDKHVMVPKCNSPHAGTSSSAGAGGSAAPSTVSHASAVGNKSPDHLLLGSQSPKSQTTPATVAQAASGLLKAIEDTFSGYNSGDEHLQPKEGKITADEWQRKDEQFAKCMADRGYILKPVEEDGACLFRSISLQIYGDEEMHDVIRQHTMDYIYKNREYFSHFVTEDINNYIKRKRRKESHGNHIEIQAMSEIYNRPVEVYCYKPTPINIFNSEQLNNGYAPLRLSYQRGSHYNAILDPYNATVGVGLGLAGYKPDLQTKEATRLSEQLEIEQTMFEDKLKTTDWEATNEAIEEQIARESYLQWCRDNLRSRNNTTNSASTSATVTSAEAASDCEASPSKYAAQRSSSSQLGAATNNSTVTTTSMIGSTTCSSAAGASTSTNAEHNFASSLSPKHMSTKKCDETGFESDDTDMSSTSSVGGSGGSDNCSPSTMGRTKNSKMRTSSVSLRTGKKRRRDAQIKTSEDDSASTQKSPKCDTALDKRSMTPDFEHQQPCTSKQSNTPEKQGTAASTSSPTDTATTKQQAASSFYQELLEASYASQEFDQLNESEMLQRAIQMSTRDYIEDQKRKYLYGP